MLVNLRIIEKNRLAKLQKTVTAPKVIITTRLQLLVEILRPTPELVEVAEVVEAVIVTAAIEEEELLTVHTSQRSKQYQQL